MSTSTLIYSSILYAPCTPRRFAVEFITVRLRSRRHESSQDRGRLIPSRDPVYPESTVWGVRPERLRSQWTDDRRCRGGPTIMSSAARPSTRLERVLTTLSLRTQSKGPGTSADGPESGFDTSRPKHPYVPKTFRQHPEVHVKLLPRSSEPKKTETTT